MVDPDDALLEHFRRKKACEWCGRKARTGLQPHHLFSRGMGGGSRLDVAINLIALCHECHRAHHDGNEPERADLVAKIAAREGLLQDQILADIHRMLRTPRNKYEPRPAAQDQRHRRGLRKARSAPRDGPAQPEAEGPGGGGAEP